MSLFLGRVEKRLAPTFSEPPISPVYLGGSDAGGGQASALTVPTVWACVTLLANAVSTLPLEAFRRAPDGVPRQIINPPLLTRPSADMTQSEWLNMLMVSLLLRGNAIGRIVARDSYLRPTQIDLLNPDTVTINVDRDTGKVTYKAGVTQQDITDDVWHMRGLTLPGTRVGLSPIDHMASTLKIDVSSRQFAVDFFSGGGIPKAVVSTDQAVNQEQSRTIKDRLLAATRNREPIVLGQGLTYKTISVNPEESQFLMTQQQNVSQIARYFGIPAEMVGGSSGNSLTYANVEQQQINFYLQGVQPWLKRIEDSLFPLLPDPQYCRFNEAALLRTDAETQAKIDNQMLAGKIVAPSEIRQRMGLPPMTDAQKAEADMLPLSVTPLGGVKALPGLLTPPGPVAPVPAAEVGAQANSLRLDQLHINVMPSAAPEVRQDIHVAAPEVRLEQPITVQPSSAPEVRQDITVQPAAAPDVRVVTVGDKPSPTQLRSRRVERDVHGDIVRIVEE